MLPQMRTLHPGAENARRENGHEIAGRRNGRQLQSAV